MNDLVKTLRINGETIPAETEPGTAPYETEAASPDGEETTEPAGGPTEGIGKPDQPQTETQEEPQETARPVQWEEAPETVATVGVDLPDPPPAEVNWLAWTGFGLAAVLAVVAAALSVLLYRSRKRRPAGKARPTAKPSGPIRVGKLHEQGDRESQQDCFAVSPEELAASRGLLAVVADGMGGLENGDRVSQTAVAAMLDSFLTAPGDPQQVLLALAEQANKAVNRLLGPEMLGKSGSTLVAGLACGGWFHYISIGDSRICLYREGRLVQLNREHIYRNDLVVQALNGTGTLSGAACHPKTAGLTSYLGMGQLKYVDIPAQPVEILPGDKFILMSDGVYNALSEHEIAQALEAPAERAAEALGGMIREKAYRNQDNYTAVILAC